MYADSYLVAVEGALSHGAFQPRAQVLADDRVLVVEDQPVRAVRQGLSQIIITYLYSRHDVVAARAGTTHTLWIL